MNRLVGCCSTTLRVFQRVVCPPSISSLVTLRHYSTNSLSNGGSHSGTPHSSAIQPPTRTCEDLCVDEDSYFCSTTATTSTHPADQVDEATKQLWIKEQNDLKSQLILTDDLPWTIEGLPSSSTSVPLQYVAGVDLSFIKDNNVDACASIVVLEFPSLNVVYEDFEMVKLTLPYISGFLAFREVSFLVALVDKIKQNSPQFTPQMILVDGNGYLHPRGFGLASHLGVLTGIPTIGIGKTFLFVDGLGVKDIKKQVEQKCKRGGDHIDLVGNSGITWGAAVRSHDDSTNSIFVSQGHKISLPSALLVVSKCTIYRIPEPVRQADLRSRAYLREHPL